MPLQEHLVVHLQEMYATEKDLKGYLQDTQAQIHDARLSQGVDGALQGIDRELDILSQCLSTFGQAPPDMTSPIVDAFKVQDQVTMDLMPNATAADHDVHVALDIINAANLEIAMYQGMISMAQALGRDDLANLLRRNLDQEQQDLTLTNTLLPSLLNQSSSQQRAA